MCLEKRVFYRVISGMHASINTHLSAQYLFKGTCEINRIVNCYNIESLHSVPCGGANSKIIWGVSSIVGLTSLIVYACCGGPRVYVRHGGSPSVIYNGANIYNNVYV